MKKWLNRGGLSTSFRLETDGNPLYPPYQGDRPDSRSPLISGAGGVSGWFLEGLTLPLFPGTVIKLKFTGWTGDFYAQRPGFLRFYGEG